MQHKRTGVVKKYYGLFSVISVEPQRTTFCFVVTLHNCTNVSSTLMNLVLARVLITALSSLSPTAKGKLKRLFFEPSNAEEQKEWIKAIKYARLYDVLRVLPELTLILIRLCVAVLKAGKEERDNARLRTRSSSFSGVGAVKRASIQDDDEGYYGDASSKRLDSLDGRRPGLSKAYTSGNLRQGRIEERQADEGLGEFSPFDAAEQWDLGQPESTGQMGIPVGKRAFSRHSDV